MVAERIAPERDFRGPGCDARCEVVRAIVPGRFGRLELLLHDPASHEAYGRRLAGPVDERPRTIEAGPIVVDQALLRVLVDGRDVRLTRLEWDILSYLAERLGDIPTQRAIVSAVWGAEIPDYYHFRTLRSHLTRIRAKLAPYQAHIWTRTAVGYGLFDRPQPPALRFARRLPDGRWARWWERCACCGRTDHSHWARGRCQRCRPGGGVKRLIHYGPCGMPRADLDGAP